MSFKSLQSFSLMSLFVRDKHVKSIFIFSLENEYYGLTVEETSQVLQSTIYNKIPGSPDYVLGVFDVRGDIVTLIDLKMKLNLDNKSEENDQDIILVNYKGEVVGLLVDKAITLQRVPIGRVTDKLENASKKIDQKYLNGTITLEEGEVINLLKLETVLADYDQQNVTGKLKKELDKKNKIELSEKELSKLDLIEDEPSKSPSPS